MSHRREDFSAYLFLVIAPVLWAGNFLTGRVMHGHIPPFSFAFYRWLLVILILLPFNFKALKYHRKLIFENFFRLAILGLLGISVYTSFIYYGLHFTSVVSASLINALVPIVILVFVRFFYQEKLTGSKVVGIISSMLGVSFILTQGNPFIILDLSYNYGDLLVFLAVIAWALFSVLSKKLPKIFPPFLVLLLIAVWGEIFLLPCFLLEHHIGRVVSFDMPSMLSILYAAIGSSVLAITFWNIGVRDVGPAKAGYFFNLLTVFASALAIIFLGEKIHFYHVLGMIFVFFGIYMATVTVKRRLHNS